VRRRLLATGALAVLVAIALASVDPPQAQAPEPLQADAALALSGDVDYLRTRRAAELVLSGAARFLIVTGTGKGVGGDSAPELQRAAERFGVPRERILAETRSRSTHENLLFVAPLVRQHGFRRVLLVTSRSHLRRALLVARHELPEVEWLPVAVRDAGPLPRDVRNRLGEWLKLVVYACRGWI
jgi:uncharacterized SAM-binding protein YcdF (DUF218 family)